MIEPISPSSLEKYVPDDERLTYINDSIRDTWDGLVAMVAKSPTLADYSKMCACFELYKAVGWHITEKNDYYIFMPSDKYE